MSSLLSLDLWPKPLRGKVVVKFVPMQLKGFPLLWWGGSDWIRCSTACSLLRQKANTRKISCETLLSGQFMLSTQLRILIYPVTLCHVEYTPFIHVFSWSVMFCFCHIWLHLVPCTVNFSQLIRICCPHFWLHLGLYRPPSQALLEKSSPSIIPLFKVYSKLMVSMLEILFWSERSGECLAQVL